MPCTSYSGLLSSTHHHWQEQAQLDVHSLVVGANTNGCVCRRCVRRSMSEWLANRLHNAIHGKVLLAVVHGLGECVVSNVCWSRAWFPLFVAEGIRHWPCSLRTASMSCGVCTATVPLTIRCSSTALWLLYTTLLSMADTPPSKWCVVRELDDQV